MFLKAADDDPEMADMQEVKELYVHTTMSGVKKIALDKRYSISGDLDGIFLCESSDLVNK